MLKHSPFLGRHIILAYLCLRNMSDRHTALVRLGYSSIIYMKPRTVSFANGGPRPAKGSERTVDYKGNEHSKPIHSEFHHITSAVLINKGWHASAFPPLFFLVLFLPCYSIERKLWLMKHIGKKERDTFTDERYLQWGM